MTSRLLDKLNMLDRRWIFLAMAMAVLAPILLQIGSDETPSPPTIKLFDEIERLPEGSRILMAMDFDPTSAAELYPMALAFTRHCGVRRHKLFFVTIWPTGKPMIESTIKGVIQADFGSGDRPYVYGVDYVNLGYLAGDAVAISQMSSDIRKARPQDARGTNLDQLPIMTGVTSVKDMARQLRKIFPLQWAAPGFSRRNCSPITPTNFWDSSQESAARSSMKRCWRRNIQIRMPTGVSVLPFCEAEHSVGHIG